MEEDAAREELGTQFDMVIRDLYGVVSSMRPVYGKAPPASIVRLFENKVSLFKKNRYVGHERFIPRVLADTIRAVCQNMARGAWGSDHDVIKAVHDMSLADEEFELVLQYALENGRAMDVADTYDKYNTAVPESRRRILRRREGLCARGKHVAP